MSLGQARFAIRVAKSKLRLIDADLQNNRSAAQLRVRFAPLRDAAAGYLSGVGWGGQRHQWYFTVALPE